MGVILFKALVALASSCLGIWALRSPTLATIGERAFIRRALLLQLLPSLGLFAALYVFGNAQVTSDVPTYYLPAARAVLAGQMPFRDFPLSYAPLFPYIGGAILFAWDSGKAFALFAIAINALALLLWHSAAAAAVDERAARQSSILYATSGHIALQTLLGTNQVWIAAGLAASTLALLRGRSGSSGLAQAVAVSSTKFLTLLFWPVLWICAPDRRLWLAGPILLGGAVYGGFALAGADVLYPLQRESAAISSGNIPYLIDPLFHAGPRFFDAMTLAVLLSIIAWLYWNARALTPQQRPALLFAALVLIGFAFMLISKKSFTGYAVFFLYPAMVMLARDAAKSRLTLFFLLLFNTLLAVEPSIWFRLGAGGQSLGDWLPHASAVSAGTFVCVELLLLGTYGYLTYLSVRATREAVGSIAKRLPIVTA